MRLEKGEKLVRREVVHIRPWGFFTVRGHYEHYIVIFTCGHFYITSYGKDIALMQFALGKGMKPKHKCYDCINNKPISLTALQQETPRWVWNEQNFDRFLTRPKTFLIAIEKRDYFTVPSDMMLEVKEPRN